MTENEISKVILNASIEVHRTLGGPGLLESVYEEALAWELSQAGMEIQRQLFVPIKYKTVELATPLKLDLLVNGKVIVECKATSRYSEIFEAQTLTLSATDETQTGHCRQLWGTAGQRRLPPCRRWALK